MSNIGQRTQIALAAGIATLATLGCSGTSNNNQATGGSAISASGGATAAGGGVTQGGTSEIAGGNASAGGSPIGLAALAAAASLTFSIDLSRGPASQYAPANAPTAVSPYIYGINGFGYMVARKTRFGLIRQGGDNATPYNWTVDYTNSGADYCYYQGQAENGNLAGHVTATTGDTIPAAQTKSEAFLATIPILDFVAAKWDRNVGWSDSGSAACPGTDSACSSRSGSYKANVKDMLTGDPGYGQPLDFASSDPNSPAFVGNVMAKGSAFCSCAPGTASCSGCTLATSPVAQDEFVNFIKVNYGSTGAPVFFDLDNEPNYWPSTHPELYANNCGSGTVTWDDVVSRNVKAAKAAKAAWSNTKVFGPVVAQDGLVYGGDYSSPHFVAGTLEFSDYYLQQLATESVSAGVSLLDVFDVHYYTVGTGDSQCLLAPRLFWDPSTTDLSAATANSLDFNFGDHSYFDQNWYPRKTIPRLLQKIKNAYSGKNLPLPGLSFSEYNAGCETAISGGVAEADLLGIFGREGVYAATAWPLNCGTDNCNSNFLAAAFDLYRNYDGNGAVVGDTAVLASTSEPEQTSVYAFISSSNANAVDLVVVNKNSSAQSVAISVANAPALTTAKLYQLAGSTAAVAATTGAAPAVACSAGTCTLTISMPGVSASTIILR